MLLHEWASIFWGRQPPLDPARFDTGPRSPNAPPLSGTRTERSRRLNLRLLSPPPLSLSLSLSLSLTDPLVYKDAVTSELSAPDNASSTDTALNSAKDIYMLDLIGSIMIAMLSNSAPASYMH